MLQESIRLIKNYAYREDSKQFLSQNTGIGNCHDVNISELGVMF